MMETVMDKENEDEKQFFRDLSATEEQAVQEVRGFEETYYSLIQGMMPALPWQADFNTKLQSHIEQNFAEAYKFTRELSQAENMQISFESMLRIFRSVSTPSQHRCRISQRHTARWHWARLKRRPQIER
jgi:hypothetical protein